ncbi:TPA: gamma subclass chorismate mutase AroQ, partial [Serratia marcescens]
MFRALLIACCLTSFPALADGAAALGELVNQRLSLMKDVAGYKAQQHLPIEDLAQEAKVLASAQAEAGRLGLEPASVRPFIAAQMDAAKAI